MSKRMLLVSITFLCLFLFYSVSYAVGDYLD